MRLDSNSLLVIAMVLMVGVLFWQSRQQKKNQQKVNEFRESLVPGREIATYSGLLGTVESVDLDAETIIINSEGSLSKWRLQAITEPPIIPAFISDDDVDEEGNPLPKADTDEEGEAEAMTPAVDQVDYEETTEVSSDDTISRE